MFGSHLSIGGGLYHAIESARAYGMDTVQIFTRNQQQWHAKPLGDDEVRLWKEQQHTAGFAKTVSHGSYLVNLGSPDPVLWKTSIDAFAAELQRCQGLGIPYAVIHPGAHTGSGEDAGIARVAEALVAVREKAAAPKVTICLEITAGQGSCLGCRLEHLAQMRKLAGRRGIGFCLDTAHLFAAGYDFRGRKYGPFIREADRVLGLGNIKVWHLNDSKVDFNSHLDRHAHIGKGKIGLEGFRPLVRDRAFANVPKILETPKAKDERGREWDAVNLAVLRRLAGV